MLDLISGLLEELELIKKIYPSIYDAAVKAVREKRVKKYLAFDTGESLFVVVGEHADYFVSLDIRKSIIAVCSCMDHLYNVTAKKSSVTEFSFQKRYCYHAVSVLISFLSELAYMSGHEQLRKFRSKEYLPEIILEKGDFLDILLDSVIPVVSF